MVSMICGRFSGLCETSGWREFSPSVEQCIRPWLSFCHAVSCYMGTCSWSLHGTLMRSIVHAHNLQQLPQLGIEEEIPDEWAMHAKTL